MSSSSLDDILLRQTWFLYHLPPTTHARRKQFSDKNASRALQSVGDNTSYVSWKFASKEAKNDDYSIWHMQSFSKEDEMMVAEVVAFWEERICFARGKANWYKAAVRWIGCEDHHCQWSQTEMALMVTQLLRDSVREKDCSATTLVFQVPTHLTDCGLDTVSLSIPPANMNQFCQSIEESRPLGEDAFPVIRALHNFVRQNFNLNLQTFRLTKFTTSQALIDQDGRIQPYNGVSALVKTVTERLATRHGGNHEND
ncbi:hypothetical protein FisN_23Lu162 [Fistulifera solaris]|uniref:Uncharacterized protein n=1 Tax=Fistulifera solaris TaxID=1519565 RepID=A0A1Z5K4N5_FISSO|nr:hypothetical protein FisN_23Lu162 [Fistulifera solaris]|eukprot:GAX21217.1 hypothetical protein FisN_23Lu162 [Fistulifera solaris]